MLEIHISTEFRSVDMMHNLIFKRCGVPLSHAQAMHKFRKCHCHWPALICLYVVGLRVFLFTFDRWIAEMPTILILIDAHNSTPHPRYSLIAMEMIYWPWRLKPCLMLIPWCQIFFSKLCHYVSYWHLFS